MGAAVRAAADALGGATRVILGNPHADHRGGAGAIGAPVQCHTDDREDAEGDGGAHYFDSAAAAPVRAVRKRTFGAGTAVRCRSARRCGGRPRRRLEVVHLPGDSPGCIGLWRESDRLAITNDCFALFHPALPFPGRRPRIPHPAFNWSTEGCRASIAKLAALGPATCWPAHYGPLRGDVAAQLRAR